MIDLHFDERTAKKLRQALRKADSTEIGGVLAGEHVSDGVFQVIGLSVQRTGGAFASFRRTLWPHRRFLRRFFARTGREYQRFNYLGEWHSHPSFPAEPSMTDVREMQRLVEDGHQEVNFLALVVVKLGRTGGLEGSAHAFRPGIAPVRIRLHLPCGAGRKNQGWARRIRNAMRAPCRESKRLRRNGLGGSTPFDVEGSG